MSSFPLFGRDCFSTSFRLCSAASILRSKVLLNVVVVAAVVAVVVVVVVVVVVGCFCYSVRPIFCSSSHRSVFFL